MSAEEELLKRLKTYKRKFYVNRILRGIALFIAFFVSIWLVLAGLESIMWFSSGIRTILLFTFLLCAVFLFQKLLFSYILPLLLPKRQIGDDEVAQQIRTLFPQIDDKLLNTIQLQRKTDSPLLRASLAARTKDLAKINFSQGIKLGQNRRYLKFAIPPTLAFLVLLWFSPERITNGTERLVRFGQVYEKPVPFHFELANDSLTCFRNEDYLVKLHLSGEQIPDQIMIVIDDRKIPMRKSGPRDFEYLLNKVQKDVDFAFNAEQYKSKKHTLRVYPKAKLQSLVVKLSFPAYLNRPMEILENNGQLIVPEGTEAQWLLTAKDTEQVSIVWNDSISIPTEHKLETFSFTKTLTIPENYKIVVQNKHHVNTQISPFHIEVIRDEYPDIQLQYFQDTLLYDHILLAGSLRDDYGLNRLTLFYKTVENQPFKSITIPIKTNLTEQKFYFDWSLEKIDFDSNNPIKYYLSVWDNDGFNGSKATKTAILEFRKPDLKSLKKSLKNSREKTQAEIDQSLKDARELEEQLEKTEEKLKGKKELTWQEKKLIEDLLKKKEEMQESLDKLKEEYEGFKEKENTFGQPSKEVQEKIEQLQKLMDDLLDEETKQLYDQLEKLLEENNSSEQIQDILEQLNKDKNLEKELDRTLELFKRLQLKTEIAEQIEAIESLAEKQEALAEDSMDKDENLDSLKREQEESNEAFEELQKEQDKIEDKNQELKNPQSIPNSDEQEKSIKESQKEAQESLENKKRKDAEKAQKKAAEQMKQMAQQLEQMQGGMEMEMLSENLDNLRDIVDNLVKLSFNQEKVMIDFRKVNQSDPRFLTLSQEQLKLRDDAKILEDSLLSLANRVFQIQSFVTREVGQMNQEMDAAAAAIKERDKNKATGKMQFAMTSMNNLALLLDDVLQQMQQQMADAMGNGKGNKEKGEMPGLGEMQKELNEQINELKKSGKSGRQLSEELARMAAQQERLRKTIEQLNEGKGGGLPGGKDLMEQMEETESDLVNKRLTNEMIQRQKQILSRLLQLEDAMREKEMDEERKGQTATEYEKQIPKAFEDYMKAKEKELELLKTVPVQLNPYYKKEVTEYFKRIK